MHVPCSEDASSSATFVRNLSYHFSGCQDNKMGQPTPRQAASDADVRSCFAVMRQLRTYLASEEDFLQRVRGLEAAQGYKLAFVSAGDQVVAAAGYAYYSTMERADPRCAPPWLRRPAWLTCCVIGQVQQAGGLHSAGPRTAETCLCTTS